jgi:hypothetical protein
MSLTPQDSLIAYEWESTLRIFSMILFLSLVLLLGFLSRELENALFFTMTTSGVIFFLFMIT